MGAGIGPAEGDSANSQGIGRLRAALQAHMWSGMLLKDPSARLSSLSGAGSPSLLSGTRGPRIPPSPEEHIRARNAPLPGCKAVASPSHELSLGRWLLHL